MLWEMQRNASHGRLLKEVTIELEKQEHTRDPSIC